MHAVAKAFDLDNSVGIAPHDFNYDLYVINIIFLYCSVKTKLPTNSAPYPDAEDSLVRLFAREV